MKKERGGIFVVSAPSGAGKTTLCQRLCGLDPGIRLSVSYTTRERRLAEIDGVHYTFVDEDEFRTMIDEGEFGEWAQVHGNFYGTSRRQIEEAMKSGIDVLLDIDVQGARQIREHFADSILIFILPPSLEELQRRLRGRGTDSAEVIARRLQKAKDEIVEYKGYDYVIINDSLEEALELLRSVVRTQRALVRRVDHAWVDEMFFKEA